MKVIQIHHPHQYQISDFPEQSIAIGFFDGVHEGHKRLIQTARKKADEKQWKCGVMTFDPHPSVVLGKKTGNIQYITPMEQKIELMEELGVDYLFVVRFTSAFASLLPEKFVSQYLITLHAKHVVCGFDFTYGKFGKGTAETLREHANGYFEVTVIPKQVLWNEKISSTAIRQLLKSGELEKVNQLLGRYYETKGTVVGGEKRGRTLGFPTANVASDPYYMIPKTGIYIVRFFVQGKWENGVCNVGYNPTFQDPTISDMTVEVFLFNFDQLIYGEPVIVQWHKRLRDELKFDNVEELVVQMNKDKEDGIAYFQEFQ